MHIHEGKAHTRGVVAVGRDWRRPTDIHNLNLDKLAPKAELYASLGLVIQ